MSKIRLKKQNRKLDKTLLILTLVFCVLGLIAVADASAPQALNVFGDKFYFVKQQAVWALFGVFLLIVFSNVHYTFWSRIATPLFWGSLLFLGLVLIPSVGTRILGARRWIIFGPISIQPSEIVKLTIAMYLAKLAEGKKGALAYFIPLAIVVGLIMLEPDLGTTLIISLLALSQIFISGINIVYFLGATLIGILTSTLLIITSSYRKDRFLSFIKATQDPLGRDYHIRQVLLALGSGGLFGVGLGQSRQKYLFLPEAATDSIFAIIAEETGFFGALILILLFLIFIYRGIKIAMHAPDKFSQVLAIGIVAWIGGQTLLNIGSMVALVPLTGIPLPFFSYGGSSLVMLLLACGILLNISKYSN